MFEGFSDPEKLKSDIEKGKVITKDLKTYARLESNKEMIRVNMIDNVLFQPKRYNVAAKWACQHLLDLWDIGEEFDPYTFYPGYELKDYEEYKLDILARHINAVYGSTGLNFMKNFLYPKKVAEQDEWYKLSGMK